jgi:Flp pilus assembly protein TadD
LKAFDSGIRALDLYPNDAHLERALGILAYKRGDFARTTQFKDALAKSPTDGEALFCLGMAQYRSKSLENREALEKALRTQLPASMKEQVQKALEDLSKQAKRA